MSQIPWLTVREVADQLQVTEETVRRWIRRGELGALELGGPRTVYRIRTDDLDHFMWQRYNRPAPNVSPPRPVRRSIDFQDMVEHLPVVTFLYDPGRDGPSRITYVSSEIEDLLGVPREEWYEDMWTVWRSLAIPEDLEQSQAGRERTTREWQSGDIQEDHVSTEVRMKTRAGDMVWVAVDMELVRAESGQPLYWSGVVIDITERKQVEEQLRERVRREQWLDAFSQRAVSEESLSELFDEAVRVVTEGLEVEYGRLFEIMPGSEQVRLRSGVGWERGKIGSEEVETGPDGLGPPDLQVSGHGQVAYTLAAGEPVISADLSREKRFDGPGVVRRHGVLSGVCVLIPGKGRPYGLLAAHSLRRRSYSEGDVNFIQAVANTLAMAVSRSGERWMTVPEVAVFLRVNVETVRRWIRSGDLAAVLLGGSRTGYRIHSSDLEKFTRQRSL